MSSAYFYTTGAAYITNGNQNRPCNERIFKSHFKLNPAGYETLYCRMQNLVPPSTESKCNDLTYTDFQPSHLLWVINYAFTYSSMDVCSSFFGVSRKTFQKYIWAGFLFLAHMHHDLVRIA